MSTTTPLGFIVPVDADAPNGPVQIGGNAEKADELLQAGGVAKSIWVPGEVTRASAALGSFSTPILVELPRLKENQVVEILVFGTAKCSVESTGAAGGSLCLKVGTSASPTQNLKSVSFAEINVGAGNFVQFVTLPGSNRVLAAQVPNGLPTARGWQTNNLAKAYFVATAEVKPCVVELQGASSSGTLTAKEVWLSAHPVG